MNYSQLIAAIGDWTARSDLSTPATLFLELAEGRIARDLRLSRFTATATLTIPAAATSVDLPADFLEGRSLTGGAYPWTQASPDQLREAAISGLDPYLWACFNGKLNVPTASESDRSFVLTYYQRIPALNGTTQTTNWLIEQHAGVYLWAALAEAAVYTKSPPMLAMYEQRYADAVSSLRVLDARSVNFAAELPAGSVV